MQEEFEPSQAEQLLAGKFDLESTPEQMKGLVDSEIPWYLELREYLSEPINGDTESNEGIVQITDEDFIDGRIPALNLQNGVTSVDLFVQDGVDQETNEPLYRQKHIDTGLGGFLVGAVSDKERFKNIMGYINQAGNEVGGDPVATEHLKVWGQSHGIEMTRENVELIPEKVLSARKKEIEGLLQRIAEVKQESVRKKLDAIGAAYVRDDDERRKAARLV